MIPRQLILAAALVSGCAADTSTLDLASPELDTCAAGVTVVVDGESEYFPALCQEGSICPFELCAGGCDANLGLITACGLGDHSGDEAARAFNPDHPYCETGADCLGGGKCIFEVGCDAPRGFCCTAPICTQLTDLELSRYVCPDDYDCSLYCGCDGQTFEGAPTKAFRAAGPCE